MGSRQKNRLADMRDRRRLKHAGRILFAAQIGPKNQTTHAVGDHIHRLYRLPIGVFQTRQESSERRAKILYGRACWASCTY